MAVFRHFLDNASFVLANISHLDGLDHSLHLLLRHHARTNPVTLFLVILCPNYAFFVPFSNRVILEKADLYGLVFMSKWSTSIGLSPRFKLYCENLSILRYRI